MSGVEEVRPEALIAVHRLEAAEADPSVEQYVDAVLEVVAEQLQPLIRQAQAEALQEAADNMPLRRPGQPYELAAGWLRDRADYRVGGS